MIPWLPHWLVIAMHWVGYASMLLIIARGVWPRLLRRRSKQRTLAILATTLLLLPMNAMFATRVHADGRTAQTASDGPPAPDPGGPGGNVTPGAGFRYYRYCREMEWYCKFDETGNMVAEMYYFCLTLMSTLGE